MPAFQRSPRTVIGLGLILHLTYLLAMFDTYFHSPIVHVDNSHPVRQHTEDHVLADRLVLMVGKYSFAVRFVVTVYLWLILTRLPCSQLTGYEPIWSLHLAVLRGYPWGRTRRWPLISDPSYESEAVSVYRMRGYPRKADPVVSPPSKQYRRDRPPSDFELAFRQMSLS